MKTTITKIINVSAFNHENIQSNKFREKHNSIRISLEKKIQNDFCEQNFKALPHNMAKSCGQGKTLSVATLFKILAM